MTSPADDAGIGERRSQWVRSPGTPAAVNPAATVAIS